MTEEPIVVSDHQASRYDLMVARHPTTVLAEAQEAAKALQQVIAGKPKPVIINGQQYLEFEDWQTVGKFYGVTAKIVEGSTKLVQVGDVSGYEARAVVIRLSDGLEISAAEAMCLSDEDRWSSRPLFQLRSMAQTRACAKALRNVLAWVVVLAGYRPTPAEEIEGVAPTPIQAPKRKSETTNGHGEVKHKLWQECLSLANGNEAEARKTLASLSSFTNKEGKLVAGKRDVAELSETWALATYEKLHKRDDPKPIAFD